MEEVGHKKQASGARGCKAAFEQRREVMVDVMPSDDAWARLAGTIEDFNLLLSEESGRKGLRGQPFFLERP